MARGPCQRHGWISGATLLAGLLSLCLPMKAAHAKTWEQRLKEQVAQLEKRVGHLDKKEAEKGPLPDRLRHLDQRVTAQEEKRAIVVRHPELTNSKGEADLQTLSMALVQIKGRVRKIEIDDEPPQPDTPKDGDGKKEAPPPAKTRPAKKEVEWPSVLEFSASASLSYIETGRWLEGAPRRRTRSRDDFLHTGYEGVLSLTVLLKGLKEEIRSVEVAVIVTRGVSPFRFSAPPSYDLAWSAGRGRMWNRAKRTWSNLDRWTQGVRHRWVEEGPRRKTLRPHVVAYAKRVVTKHGRVVQFRPPKEFRGGEATPGASASSADPTVYVTNTGKKYHLRSCSYCRKSRRAVGLSAAKRAGYTPCRVCKPPR